MASSQNSFRLTDKKKSINENTVCDTDDYKMPSSKSKLHHFIGILLAALVGVCYTTMGFVVKYLKTKSPVDLGFMTSFGAVIFALPFVINCRHHGVDRKFFVLILMFGFFVATTIITRYTALKMLPLGEASAIIFSSPIFTAIFARLLLKEKINRGVIFSLIFSFVGLLLVAKVPKTIKMAMEQSSSRFGSYEHSIGCAYAFTAVIVMSLCGIVARKLHYVNQSTVTLGQGAFSTMFLLAVSPAFSGFSFQGDCSYKSWMFTGVGLYGFITNGLFITSLKYENPAVVLSLVMSTDIMLSFLIQLIFFKDPVDSYSCSGAILVFVSGMILPFGKWIITLPYRSPIRRKFEWMNK